jgi:dUTP pyrophosphatase
MTDAVTFEHVQQVIEDRLVEAYGCKKEDLHLDSLMESFGFDSLDAVEFSLEMEEHFDIDPLSLEDLKQPTLRDIVGAIFKAYEEEHPSPKAAKKVATEEKKTLPFIVGDPLRLPVVTAREVEVKILDPRIGKEFAPPKYKTDGSACIDLIACIDEPLLLREGEDKLIPTGLAIYIKDPNLVGLVFSRSGLSVNEKLVLGNCVAVIDSDYQGPLMVDPWNRAQVEHRALPVAEDADPLVETHICLKQIDKSKVINPGDRIAQIMFVPVVRAGLNFVVEFSSATGRGEGGFGSTGKHDVAFTEDLLGR